MKRFIYIAILILLFASCTPKKRTVQTLDLKQETKKEQLTKNDSMLTDRSKTHETLSETKAVDTRMTDNTVSNTLIVTYDTRGDPNPATGNYPVLNYMLNRTQTISDFAQKEDFEKILFSEIENDIIRDYRNLYAQTLDSLTHYKAKTQSKEHTPANKKLFISGFISAMILMLAIYFLRKSKIIALFLAVFKSR